MPQRIQRQRTKEWQVPDGAVDVGRGTRWDNPYRPVHTDKGYVVQDNNGVRYPGYGPFISVTGAIRDCVRLYHEVEVDYGLTDLDEIVESLAGKDLVCSCPLDQPCHADVLLWVANGRKRAAMSDQMSTPPTPRYELTLTIQGNTLDEIHEELRSAEKGFHLDRRSPSNFSARDEWTIRSERYSSVMRQRNPDMTPERYRAEFQAWMDGEARERRTNGWHRWRGSRLLIDGVECTEGTGEADTDAE